MTKTDENKNLKFDHAKSEIVKHYRLATLGVFNKDIYGLNSSLPVATIEISNATIEISKTTTATKNTLSSHLPKLSNKVHAIMPFHALLKILNSFQSML